MLGLGIGEILLVCLVVLLVVGPDRLPQFARSAGKMYGQLRRTADDLRRSLVLEADRQDAEERYRAVQERRRRAEEERRAAEAASPGVTAQDEHLPGVDEGAARASDDPHPPAGDQDLESLLADPAGPYAAGTSLDQVAQRWRTEGLAPMDQDGAPPLTGDGALPPGVDDDPPPPGISAEEWAEVPPRIRDMLRGRSGGQG